MVSRGVIALALAGAGCFVDSGGSGSSASTSGAETTSAASSDSTDKTTTDKTTSDSSTSSTTEPTSTATSTATTSSTDPSTTSGGACSAIGGPCSGEVECCGECASCTAKGICAANDGLCGVCEICTDQSACAQAPVDHACGEPFDCANVVYSLMEGTCFGYQGTVPGRCTVDGACTPPNHKLCDTPGVAIVSCPNCLRDDNPCQEGADAATITVETVCFTDNRVCDGQCNGNDYYTYTCDNNGQCTESSSESCDPYICDNGCLSSCSAGTDCVNSAECFNGECI